MVDVSRSVPSCPFDHNTILNPAETYAELRALGELIWSSSNGGFWVATSYELVKEILAHPEVFSSAVMTGPDGGSCGGIFIPSDNTFLVSRMIPEETDPPEWRDYRRLVMRQMSPAAVKKLHPVIERYARRYVDRIIDLGECDMVDDIASPIPASVMLDLMGLDADAWQKYVDPFHQLIGSPPGSADAAQAIDGVKAIVEELREAVRDRRGGSGEDLITVVANATIAGTQITEENATATVYTLMTGGVDTTANFLGNAFHHLSGHPEVRDALIADPSRLPLAIEEFMRFASPVQAVARTVIRPYTLAGQALDPGDRVLVPFTSANRDESVFDEPHTYEYDRYPNPHVGFGRGIHKCAGAHLARAEIEIALSEVLTRMPDFVVDAAHSHPYPNLGVNSGWMKMPATFTPERDRMATVA